MPEPIVQPASLPMGTVTFLFTDIEGSTRLLQSLGADYPPVLEEHHRLVARAIAENGGVRFGSEGDAVFAVFPTPTGAVQAALDAQHAMDAASWPGTAGVRIRIGLHTGEGRLGGESYVGLDVHRAARITSAAHGGQVLLSAPTQTLVSLSLPDGVSLKDLGEHRLKDLDHPEHIFQLVAPGLRQDFPAVRSLDARRTNLPSQLTSFIGREREVTRVRELLTRTRLLTLTGPGGTGKTRLALQTASDLIDEFADGCFFVPLSPISDPALLLSSIAQVLGVQEAGGRPISETLKEYLEPRELLLVLDNFEQIVAAGPSVVDLLALAPRLKALVTSREVLHVHGENEFPVPPMGLPAPGEHPSADALGQYEAVALFIQRARAVRPDFAVTNDNAPAVSEICARLDGLPLAIELAAARVKVLDPEDILTRLSDRLALLRGGAKDLPTRQQTLRDAITWSYDLLDPGEQELFRRFSVFVGGWSLVAAEAVVGADGDALEGMSSLADKSLLRRLPNAGMEARHSMLMTIREFAWEQFVASPEADEVRRRHAEFFLALAEEAEPNLTGPDHMRWLDRIEGDHDNVRAALRWSIETDQAEVGLRIGGALWRFWHLRGHFTEGRTWLGELLALPSGKGRTAARAKGLNGIAGLVYWQADYTLAEAYWKESLSIWQELGDRGQIGEVLYSLAYIAGVAGDNARSIELFEQSVELFREVGNLSGEGNARISVGMIMGQAGDYEGATKAVRDAMAVISESGDIFGLANANGMLGRLSVDQGRFEEGRPALLETLRLFESLGDMSGIAFTLDDLATLEIGLGRFERAIVLAGAAEHLRTALGGAAPVVLVTVPLARERAKGVLDDGVIEAAWARGEAMTLQEALAFAFER
jgi:predicted ATPase/class 3 adenylate cyclase